VYAINTAARRLAASRGLGTDVYAGEV
jgi:hypothetical protein